MTDTPTNAVPNPGSREAGYMGCTCAIMDNHYGKGAPAPDGSRQFWISGDCPLHARNTIRATQETP